MKRLFSIILLCLLLVGCTAPKTTAPNMAKYEVVGTKYNQYFVVTAPDLLDALNENLQSYGMELKVKDSGIARSVFLTEDGDTWKILCHVFTEDDIKNSNLSSPSGDPADWVGFIHEVELSIFAADNAAAEKNGKYIRSLIETFTPGQSEEVEDVLGLYDEPHKDAVIDDGVTKATFGNVSYTYQKGNNRFFVNPLDEDLHNSANTGVASAIRPE